MMKGVLLQPPLDDVHTMILSANTRRLDSDQLRELLDFAAETADADCAMVARSVAVPFVDEAPSADRESVPRDGVADVENGAGL